MILNAALFLEFFYVINNCKTFQTTGRILNFNASIQIIKDITWCDKNMKYKAFYQNLTKYMNTL